MFAFFFFNDTATTEIYTLSLHDALPISGDGGAALGERGAVRADRTEEEGVGRTDAGPRARGLRGHGARGLTGRAGHDCRSEEHTSELQSRLHLVCRLLLEKKKVYSSRCA